MTRAEAITELVRIWHSPHLDLSLKAGLAEAIDALKENNLDDALVRDEADACKESESKLDLISRADAMGAVQDHFNADGFKGYDDGQKMLDRIKELPSAGSNLQPTCNRLATDLISRSALMEYCSNQKSKSIDNNDIARFPSAEAVQGWIPVGDIRKLQDILYLHIDSLEGTRNIVEAGMLSAWKEVVEYLDGMLGEDGEEE